MEGILEKKTTATLLLKKKTIIVIDYEIIWRIPISISASSVQWESLGSTCTQLSLSPTQRYYYGRIWCIGSCLEDTASCRGGGGGGVGTSSTWLSSDLNQLCPGSVLT